MRSDLRWKGAIIFIAMLLFAALVIPAGSNGKNIFKMDPIRLGLDLKGGIELLLAPDYRLNANSLNGISGNLLTKTRQANIPDPNVRLLGMADGKSYDGLVFSFASPGDAQRAMNVGAFPARMKMDLFGEPANLNMKTTVNGKNIVVRITRDAKDFPADALERSMAIINHRISESASGMAEADVRLDGKGRINVQLPGVGSLQEAKDLIAATGRMTFRIDGKIVLDGTDLNDARMGFESGKGYVINFIFKGKGAKTLEQVTTENKGKKMAVYLDETMLMDPVIEDVIPNGSGEITFGNADKEEVDKDALLMRSGALPISLKIIESTQVAPTLGKEIVRQSLFSGALGILMVVAFMILFYSVPGLMADCALVLYVLFMMGVLALFRGVLTLPGVAGIILGVGMAVDANIIIFERIKDELRNGKRMRPAFQAGFDRAFVTILDSNITTLIAAVVLFFFGSGPVQGFAVTLSLGIVISMITAIFVSRFFLELRIDHDPDRYAKFFGVKEVIQ